MKDIFKILVVVITVVFTGLNGQAQTAANNDFESWFAASLNYEMNKRWEFGLTESIRLNNNASTTESLFTNINVIYSLNKKFDFGLGGRFVKKGTGATAVNFFRFNTDVVFKQKLNKRMALRYRLRYQNKNSTSLPVNESKQNIRFKNSFAYNIKNWKLDPKISAEIFYRLKSGTKVARFNKYRVTIGTKYGLKKAGDIGVFYRFEGELNRANPMHISIAGLSYSYTIKRKKKKKK